MAVKRFKTEFPGVRYKQHATRKSGIKFDRYYSILYRLNGKLREEGLGWASAGWTAQKASIELSKLKEAQRLGQSGQTLQEKREAERTRQEAEKAAKEKAEADSITLLDVFTNHYLPEAERSKDPESVRREKGLFAIWICPLVGHMPLREITLHHMETLKNRMMDAGRAAATVRYALAVVRQLFHFAADHGLYDGQEPTRKVKKPTSDNKRTRFLSKEEAQLVLDALQGRSVEAHNMALFSLHTGARLGEITALRWGDVNFQTRALTFRDTKNKDSRHARMTQAVFEMLFSLQRGRADALVFPGRGGKQKAGVSCTFNRVVDSLGLNTGIADRRQRVCFHSLRHTFASWMLEAGASIYTVSKLLGHKTIVMTERYGHVSDGTLQDAVRAFEKGIAGKAEEKGRNAE
ncbi:MAG: site-specific integrase [Syntrophorhabdales bacterium]|jgi:integrase